MIYSSKFKLNETKSINTFTNTLVSWRDRIVPKYRCGYL